MDRSPGADKAAQPDNAVTDRSMVEDAAVRDDGMIDLRAIDFRARQKARTAEDRGRHVKEIETWQFTGDIQIRLEKGANRADVFPISLKNIREHSLLGDGCRDDVLAEIRLRILQQAFDHIASENVDAHRSQEQLTV